jgi:ubiquitin-protein ligase
MSLDTQIDDIKNVIKNNNDIIYERYISNISDITLYLRVKNMPIKIITDFNRYCFIDSEKSDENINNFNLMMIIKEKTSDNIINELLKISDIHKDIVYNDSYHIYQNIDEFSKYKIDYKQLNNLFSNYTNKKNIVNNIPKELLLSQTQINQLIINEIKKVNRNKEFNHYIYPESNDPYTLNVVLKIKDKDMKLKLLLDQKLYPFMPPKIEYISPKIKIHLLLSIINLDILKLDNWNPTIMIQDLIVNLANQLEPILDNYLDNDEYNDFEYEVIKLANITKNIEYENIITLVKNKNKIFSSDNNYWSKGTGYGNNNLPKWDINSYIKDQELQNNEITNCLTNINTKLNNKDVILPNDSLLFTFLINKISSLTLLELDKTKTLYQQLFNILANIIIKNINQLTINNLADSLKNIYEEIELLFKTSQDASNDELLLQIYTIADWYIFHAEKLVDKIIISNNIKEEYCEVMKKLQFETFEIPNNHTFKNDTNKPEQKALQRILSEISSFKKCLPLNWESSIWVRISKTNLNIFSFLISGPKDTPYENGLFEFHAYFPTDYPNTVPKVILKTTGNETVRFNPNLYANGKVCLSLLGTWRGEEGESWNPKTSTFLQVLVSIQSLILVEHPYFNEPGYETTMKTTDGKNKSKLYNNNLEPHTIKLAMTDMIKNPPKGFEDVITNHFKMKKEEIINKTLIWQQNNPSVQNNRNELLSILQNI